MFAFASGLLIGLMVGAVAGVVSWVSAAAYLEAQRMNPARADSIAEAMAAATTEMVVGSGSQVFSAEQISAASAERLAPAGQLFRRKKDNGFTIAPTRKHWTNIRN